MLKVAFIPSSTTAFLTSFASIAFTVGPRPSGNVQSFGDRVGQCTKSQVQLELLQGVKQ